MKDFNKKFCRLIVKALNIDLNKIYIGGYTELHYAVFHNDRTYLQLLIKAGADIDAKDSSGRTALHLAAMVGNVKAVAALIKAGADIDAEDNSRSTALHLAAEINMSSNGVITNAARIRIEPYIKILKLLIKAGADFKKKNSLQHTSLDIAKNKGDDLYQRFLDVIADSIAKDEIESLKECRDLQLALAMADHEELGKNSLIRDIFIPVPALQEKIYAYAWPEKDFHDLPEEHRGLIKEKINKIIEESCSATSRTRQPSCLGIC